MDQPIDEAGRMISAQNLSAIQTAWQSLGTLLQKALGQQQPADESDDKTPTEQPTEAAPPEALTGDVIPLVEKALRRDNTIRVKVIQPGQGSSGFYPAEVLERDGPKVFTRGLHMYLDHPTMTEETERPERSVANLAGVLASDAAWQANGPDGPGLYADAEVFAPFREHLDELAPHIGVSIRAMGRAAMGERDGVKVPVIEELTSAHSVDFVTRAGAGGSVLPLLESARTARVADTPPQPQEVDMELSEALGRIESLEADLARLREASVLAEASRHIGARLATADLHELTAKRLSESLLRAAPIADGALDTAALDTAIEAAVTEARAEYAAITGTGAITGMGGTPPSDDTADADFEESLKVLIGDDTLAAVAAAGRS